MEFKNFHEYNKLVRRGLVKPLACTHCKEPYTLVLGKRDIPNLVCYFCGINVVPGLDIYENVCAVVREHND